MASKEQVQEAFAGLWEKYGNTLSLLSDSLDKIEEQEKRIAKLESDLDIEPEFDIDLSIPETILKLEEAVLNRND